MKILAVAYRQRVGEYIVTFQDGSKEIFTDKSVWAVDVSGGGGLRTELDPQNTIQFLQDHLEELRFRSIPKLLE